MILSNFASSTFFFVMVLVSLSIGACIIEPINEPSIQISKIQTDRTDTYVISLYGPCNAEEIGIIKFAFDKKSQSAQIKQIHIYHGNRKKSYGSILLTFALETLKELKATSVTWLASPYDLIPGQTSYQMLPKLIKFYEKHGAEVLMQTGYTAEMIYYPH